ncbi:hypothetical protein [Streptomyces umbrinus]
MRRRPDGWLGGWLDGALDAGLDGGPDGRSGGGVDKMCPLVVTVA